MRIVNQFVPQARHDALPIFARQLGWRDEGHQAGPRNSRRGATCCPRVELIKVKLLSEFTSQDSLARTNMETWVVPRNSHRETTHGGGKRLIRTALLAKFASQDNLLLRGNEVGRRPTGFASRYNPPVVHGIHIVEEKLRTGLTSCKRRKRENCSRNSH